MSKYSAIPDFAAEDVIAVAGAVRALKDVVEQLAGQRTSASYGAPSVFVSPLEPSSLLNATHKVGDFWIRPDPPPALFFWSGAAWVKVSP